MICLTCGGPIHPERLAAQPRAVTCSAPCSAERQKQHQAAGARKAMARRRARRREKIATEAR